MVKRVNHDLVDVVGQVRAETEKAIQLFHADGICWLPKSLVEVNDDGTVTMPEWLAIDKGLV